MDIWNLLSLLWIPSLVIGIAFQIRAGVFKKYNDKKIWFSFPDRFFQASEYRRVENQLSDVGITKPEAGNLKIYFLQKCFYFLA